MIYAPSVITIVSGIHRLLFAERERGFTDTT
jgi:hypothetical protein